MRLEKTKLSVWMALFAMMDRKSRSSAEQVRYFIIPYIVGMVVITYLRVSLDLVNKEPLYGPDGQFLMNFGYWPKFDLFSWGVFLLEGLLLHIPFYTLCIRRLNDIGYGRIRSLAVFMASITPIVGIPVFIYFFMIKPGDPTENEWGSPPRPYNLILA